MEQKVRQRVILLSVPHCKKLSRHCWKLEWTFHVSPNPTSPCLCSQWLHARRSPAGKTPVLLVHSPGKRIGTAARYQQHNGHVALPSLSGSKIFGTWHHKDCRGWPSTEQIVTDLYQGGRGSQGSRSQQRSAQRSSVLMMDAVVWRGYEVVWMYRVTISRGLQGVQTGPPKGSLLAG